MKLKLRLVETVLFRDGRLSAWWFTDKDGVVRKKPPGRATLEAVRQRFTHVGLQVHQATNAGKHVCIERRGGGALPGAQRWHPLLTSTPTRVIPPAYLQDAQVEL